MSRAALLLQRARPRNLPPPTFRDLTLSTTTFQEDAFAGTQLAAISNKTPGATISLVTGGVGTVLNSLQTRLLRSLAAWAQGDGSLTLRQTIVRKGVTYTHDTTIAFVVVPASEGGFAKIWPGSDWDQRPQSGWLKSGMAVPVATVFDLVTERPSIKWGSVGFRRIRDNYRFGVGASCPGGVKEVIFDCEGRKVSVSKEQWLDASDDIGRPCSDYLYCVEFDVAAAMALIPGQTIGEAQVFATVVPNDPEIPSATIGIDLFRPTPTDQGKGFVLYPTTRPLFDKIINVALTPGHAHATDGAADYTGETAIASAYLEISNFNRGKDFVAARAYAIRMIENLPVVGGRRAGYRVNGLSKLSKISFSPYWITHVASADVEAFLGDDTDPAIVTAPRVDMFEVRGLNVKCDFARLGARLSGSLTMESDGRGGIWLNCTEAFFGDAIRAPGSGSGESVLYEGRQAGLWYYVGASSCQYICVTNTDMHDMAANGLPGVQHANWVTLDRVSGSVIQNVIGYCHNVVMRRTGGLTSLLRTHRPTIRVKYKGSRNFAWLEKTSINGPSSMPFEWTAQGEGYLPAVGTQLYEFVQITNTGASSSFGIAGGTGAKVNITVTDGRIVSIVSSDPGQKYTLGEVLTPATEGKYKFNGYGSQTPADIAITLKGNLNVYASDVDNVVAAKAAGPTKSYLLQELGGTIGELVPKLNSAWGSDWEWSIVGDPDVTRFDVPWLSHSSSNAAEGIFDHVLSASAKNPLPIGRRPATGGVDVDGDPYEDLTGIMDIHSNNQVMSSLAFNYHHRFIECYDFTVTAPLSSGRGGRHNGASIQNFISVARDASSPQAGYLQAQWRAGLWEAFTFHAPGGAGNLLFLGTGAAALSLKVRFSHGSVDDWVWTSTEGPDRDFQFSGLILRKGDPARLAALVGQPDALSKGLGGVPASQLYVDPDNNDFRPKLGSPLILEDGTVAAAKVPPEWATSENRGWALYQSDGTLA